MSADDASADASVLVHHDGAGVTTLTINRPDRHNSLSWTAMSELRAALQAAARDAQTRVVVLTGAGSKAFCTGADLSGMTAGAGAYDLHTGRGEVAGLISDLWALGKPTIAKVRGWCLAGGFGIALACDIVIAADDATFGAPEIDRGLWPYMITVPMLRSMPPKVVLELQMTGRRVPAREAAQIGFARVVPGADLDRDVDAVASQLARKSASAMKMGRDAFYAVCDKTALDALATLHPLLSVHTTLEDAQEGLAAFAEGREPIWRDR